MLLATSLDSNVNDMIEHPITRFATLQNSNHLIGLVGWHGMAERVVHAIVKDSVDLAEWLQLRINIAVRFAEQVEHRHS